MTKFPGLVNQIEHCYRWYRKQGSSNDWTDSYLKKVMVEYPCPECDGARLKRTRRLATIEGASMHDVGEMHSSSYDVFFRVSSHRRVTKRSRRSFVVK